MSNIFIKLLNMSLAASGLIMAVIFLRLIARRTPRWIICLLWGLVAFRLLCPFSIQSTFSLVSSNKAISESILSESRYQWNRMAKGGMADEYVGNIHQEKAISAYHYGAILIAKADMIWFCGAVGGLLYAVSVCLRLRGRLKEAVLLQEEIYICDHVRSPFIFGCFRPHIYLPSGMDEVDMKYVIAHEKAHLRRKDHIWKMAAFFLFTIYWFFPLCWVAFILFCRDIELACDEKVIKNFSRAEKIAYAESLLSCSFKKRTVFVYPVAFGEVGVKRRVKSILQYKKSGFGVICISIVVCIVMGLFFLTTAPKEDQAKNILNDASSNQINRHKKENELSQLLLDYDKNQIIDVAVFLQDFNSESSYANILITCNDNEAVNEQEEGEIKAIVSEYLSLAEDNVYLKYKGLETSFTEPEN